MEALKTIIDNLDNILIAVSTIFSGVIIICMMIPGEQPEKTLQKIVDLIAKFSKK